jgi:hypothetical protein
MFDPFALPIAKAISRKRRRQILGLPEPQPTVSVRAEPCWVCRDCGGTILVTKGGRALDHKVRIMTREGEQDTNVDCPGSGTAAEYET